MRTFYKVTTLLVLGALVLGSGCTGKKNKNKNGLGQEGSVVPEFLDEDGLPLTSDPFDQTHQRLEGLSFAPVYFGYDSFQLAPEEVSKIEQVAAYLNENGRTVLIVEGHCDERGSNEYNLSLGEQRALSVRTYLVNLGISADRIQSRSFGEERPAVQGTGEDAWRQNRRGEFALYE